jgi:alginate O-acetyltransferase complex protein AlgI
MLFTSLQFALFLFVVLLLLRVVAQQGSRANVLLLIASLTFYTLWNPAYLPLLLADIGVNWLLVRRIAASQGAARRTFLLASIVFTLGLLVWFKYAAFLVESALPILGQLSLALPVPDVLLPLGISFYSFQIVALAVDTYRNDTSRNDTVLRNDTILDEGPANVGRERDASAQATPGLFQYALYISFFPQLIAGPILRGRDLLPQLRAGRQPSPARARRGIWLLASGLSKKVILADFLLAPFADEVFGAPGIGNASFHWIALYAFAFQIYFDFSGYTDMARGTALLIGYELPENFHEPFLSRSPQEFWQRWHMTLSRWLSLYLFIPASRALLRRGGARWGAAGIAQLLTMTVCGLWHGAGWNFVVWGALQGVLLVAWRFPRRPGAAPLAWSDLPSLLLFFQIFCVTLVFFRSPDLASAVVYLEALFVPGELPGWPRLAALAVALSAGLHVAERAIRTRSAELQAWCAARPGRAYLEAAVCGLIAGAAVMVSGAGGEFIYFQF